MLNIFLFIIVFLYISNWIRIKLIFNLLIQPKMVFQKFADRDFIEKVNKKVDLQFDIRVQHSSLIFGYMPGTPIKPIMVISSGARKYLTDNELEWLVFHEAGHCVLWHVVKEILLQATLLLFGIITVYLFQMSAMFIFLYAVILGIIWYQIERYFEREADLFSLERITHPSGMIHANQKMKQKGTSIFYKNYLLNKLFTPHLTYDERIVMARLKLNL